MGVLTSHRKRSVDPFCKSPSLDLSSYDHVSKKLKVCQSGGQSWVLSRSSVYMYCLYPEAKQELPRVVHAPTKNSRFAFSKRGLSDKMGNSFSNPFSVSKSRYGKAGREKLGTFRYNGYREGEDEAIEGSHECRIGLGHWRDRGKGKEVIVLDDDITNEDVTEGSSIEEVEVEMEIGKNRPVDYGHQWNVSTGVGDKLVDRKVDMGNSQASMSSLVMNKEDLCLKALSLRLESNKWGKPPHEQLLDSARKREPKLQELSFQIQLTQKLLHWFQLLRPQKKVETVKEDVVREAFIPLSDEDIIDITRAFSKSNRRKILVSHEKSSIDITGEMLQCLRPGAWLNDEVINLYLELLKERENREPHKFLKCHFLNTFFYKKLIGGKDGYNFQAVRRWTTQRKLGYSLSDCDKIFVPIHKEVHWCLAVINKKDQKFQYLDSLGGRDDIVLKLLARYYVDEVKDKTGKNIDVGSWRQEFVEDLPEQENGFDCGVFMIKYTDFYSRGVGLHFKQEHMQYFRQRTANEILRLKAE